VDKPHKKLKAWQGAMDLCMTIYEITEGFPGQELYGLASQMRRAAYPYHVILRKAPLEVLERNLRNFTTLLALRSANWILKLKLQND
jgi:hypothetical protein